MDSRIAAILKFAHRPVALLFSDEKPENAVEFKEGWWACVMFSFAGAARGKTAAFGRKSFECWGGGFCFVSPLWENRPSPPLPGSTRSARCPAVKQGAEDMGCIEIRDGHHPAPEKCLRRILGDTPGGIAA